MLIRRQRRLGFAGLVTVLLLALPCAGQIPGTRVTLDPPPGFSPAERFPGFQKEDVKASIVVTEIPGPMAAIGAGFTTEGLASRGIALLGSEDTTIGGHPARLVHASQRAFGETFEKWMLLFGTPKQSVMIVGTFLRETAESLSEPIKRSLLSAKWNLTTTVDTFDGLSFRVEETSDLKISTRVSTTVLLTKDGAKVQVAPEDPLLVVGSSMSSVDLSDLEGFSKRRLAQTEHVTRVSNITGAPTTVDDLPAYELTADAHDTRTGVPIRVYQVIAGKGTDYFIVQGLVGSAQAPQFLPQFRQVARSLRKAP